jgi:hypothetical protein
MLRLPDEQQIKLTVRGCRSATWTGAFAKAVDARSEICAARTPAPDVAESVDTIPVRRDLHVPIPCSGDDTLPRVEKRAYVGAVRLEPSFNTLAAVAGDEVARTNLPFPETQLIAARKREAQVVLARRREIENLYVSLRTSALPGFTAAINSSTEKLGTERQEFRPYNFQKHAPRVDAAFFVSFDETKCPSGRIFRRS